MSLNDEELNKRWRSEMINALMAFPEGAEPTLIGILSEALARHQARLLSTPATTPQREHDELLSIAEAAKRLGVSRAFLYRHPAELRSAERRVGRKLMYSAGEIQKYVTKKSRAAV